jgi:branched-chain amino acid transport system substrate-binding protein
MTGLARTAGFLAAMLLVLLSAAGGAEQPVVKIGVILPYSGPLAAIGTQIERGLSLYVRERERDLQGIKLQIIRRDDQGRPDVSSVAAEQLIRLDRVDYVVGGATGASANAIAKATSRERIPFIAMYAVTSDLMRMSPNVIRMSITASQTSHAIGTWAAKRGLKRGVTIVNSSLSGLDAEAAFSAGFAESGGTIIAAERVEVTNVIDSLFKIKALRPDVVFAFIGPDFQSRALLRRFDEIGLARDGIRLVGSQDLVPDSALVEMGDEIRGLVTSGSYSSAAERPQNRDFVAAWMRLYNDRTLPDFTSVAAWDGMSAIFDVIKQRKGRATSDQAIEILKNWKNPNSPRGSISVDPVTREIIQDIYIRRVEFREGRPVNVEFETVPYKRALLN